MPHFIRLTHLICVLFIAQLSQLAIAQPALWSVEKNGITSYLFGTVHVGDNKMHGLDQRIKAAIANSQTVVVELNTETIGTLEMQRRTLPFMLQEQGSTLKSSLSADTYKQLKSYFSERQIDITLFDNYQPWFVMLTILRLEYQKAGFSEEFGIDKQIIEYATGLNKPIKELESLEQQLTLFGTLGGQGDAMLVDTLKQVMDFDRYFTKMVNAWKEGDYQQLNVFYKRSFDDSKYGQQAEQVMLVERNNNWMTMLTPQLTKASHFIAVGALHLPQQHGLLTQFEAQGFKVQRIR
ncbi:TraB/GumN family protein [Pseudoalteromonas sp. OOF1S-7]|uniref:TraB/GumN family protein n=1 Tax=Pseudoalteromonas sp. OOF1S-7 TaxID=2917757 RepID=UPI001EF48E7B|nr:TraB/GumN family protein [Pseudoalteromonas sp. OOF1S-7]MCG7536956.1 TraB/GumN family protein [Pseudoalteromonas sp. OOF1S-7]